MKENGFDKISPNFKTGKPPTGLNVHYFNKFKIEAIFEALLKKIEIFKFTS